jgi:putative membrane protein
MYSEMSPEGKRTLIAYLTVSAITVFVQVSVLALLEIYLADLSVETLEGAVIFVLLLGIASSLLLPYLMYFSVRRHPLLFPILAFILNGLLVLLISRFVPGVWISSLWTAIGVSLALSTTGMVVGGLFAVDDFKAYERFVIKPLMMRYAGSKTNVPGVMFLEIDGLSEDVLRQALREGYMPTMKRWLEEGDHKLASWETDLSCQTGGCQPGILHGNNHNIPAFRWYEKDSGRLLDSSVPRDVAEVEKRISDGNGLLAKGGSSRANMYSGDAKENMLTISNLGSSRHNAMEYFLFYGSPYMAARTFSIFLSHFVVEVWEGWRQLALNHRPRINRTGSYPFLRATTTGVLRELSVFALTGDMLRGLPAMYTTFVGYDEVAHHSGVRSRDALRVLKGIDKVVGWLERISMHAARPYRLVVLSDHGQSNGATFRQRTGKTLEQIVEQLVDAPIYSPPAEDETWLRINALLTDVARQDTSSGRLLQRAVKSRMDEGTVTLGPQGEQLRRGETLKPQDRSKAVVLASGNLGLIYFTAWKERMTFEEINQAFPNLIPGLLKHPAVGMVMVRSLKHGPLVLGHKGTYYLEEDRFEGQNPLQSFGPGAAAHLRREDGFSNAPDVLVNSFYDPKTGEVAAFEELVGSHGGLGGHQSRGVLVYPAELEVAEEPVVGASNLHRILKHWVPES